MWQGVTNVKLHFVVVDKAQALVHSLAFRRGMEDHPGALNGLQVLNSLLFQLPSNTLQ